MDNIDLNELLEVGSKYFSLQSPPAEGGQLLTISGCEQREFNDGRKLVLSVAEDTRQLVLNQTNLKYLVAVLGHSPGTWIGQQLVLSVGRSSYGSRMLRVNKPPVAAGPQIQPASERVQ